MVDYTPIIDDSIFNSDLEYIFILLFRYCFASYCTNADITLLASISLSFIN